MLRHDVCLFAAVWLVGSTGLSAAEPAVPSAVASEPVAEVVLWPQGAPGVGAEAAAENTVAQDQRIGRRVTKVAKPLLTVYKPAKEKDTGAAVVICPGGGYHILALDLEGTEVAAWLNGIGVTGLVLQYRVPRSKDAPKHAAPLQDAQRAIRVARQHAADWGIDPQRVGILGFSAGGHLAATAATNFATSVYEARDDADRLSCRPDFAVLVYPAYLTGEGDELQLAPELPVAAQTPPAFLVHAGDDRISATNSVAFYLALKRAGVSAELHVYPTGGHGYGLRPSEHAVSRWPDRAEQWFASRGLLKRP